MQTPITEKLIWKYHRSSASNLPARLGDSWFLVSRRKSFLILNSENIRILIILWFILQGKMLWFTPTHHWHLRLVFLRWYVPSQKEAILGHRWDLLWPDHGLFSFSALLCPLQVLFFLRTWRTSHHKKIDLLYKKKPVPLSATVSNVCFWIQIKQTSVWGAALSPSLTPFFSF